MNNRTLLVIVSIVALALVAAALFVGWQKDGRLNPGLILFVPIVLIGLLAALKRKT